MAGDAKLKHLESAHQQQVIEWARMASRSAKYPMLELLHCSLNGVKLTKTQAVIAKSQGMLSGVPDLFFASDSWKISRFIYRDETRQ